VQFPMDKQALTELEKMKSGKLTFIQLTVDPEKETIDFEKVQSSFFAILSTLMT
jgi:hypothetical protein